MKKGLAAVLLLTVLASGCAYSNAGDAEQLQSRAEKAFESSYHVRYNFSVSGKSLVRQSTGEAHLYAKDGETMFRRFYTFLNGNQTVSIYSEPGNRSTSCTRTNEGGNVSMNCTVQASTVERYIDGTSFSKDNYSVNYVGERSYAGRKCGFYRIGLPPSYFDSSRIRAGAFVDLCIDKEKGYVAYNRMKLASPLRTAQGEIRELYSLKALEYLGNASEEKVTVPEIAASEAGNGTTN